MNEINEVSIVNVLWNDIDQCFGQLGSRAPIPLMGVVGLMVLCDRLAPSASGGNKVKMESFFEDFFDACDLDKTRKAQALYQLRCALAHEYGFTGERKNGTASPDSFSLALTEEDSVCQDVKLNTVGTSHKVLININWLYSKVKSETQGYSDTDKFHIYQEDGTAMASGCLTSTSPSLSGDALTDWSNLTS